ncbi:MAG: primosomal protein N' [Clostridia bacterium]|nr:primosomal protein N' [Clostridia bacterium]
MDYPPKTYAKVAVENTAYHFDKLFDYLIPAEYNGPAFPGCRVMVPFGRGNRKRQGVIFGLSDSAGFGSVKPLSALLDEEPVLSEEMLLMAGWLRDNYYCTYYEAAKAMLPSGIHARVVTSYRAAEGVDGFTLLERRDITPQQRKILEMFVSNSGLVLEKKHITEVMNLPGNSTVPDKLVEKGLLVRNDDAIRNIKDATVKMAALAPDWEKRAGAKLTPKQREIVNLLSDVQTASVKEICYFTGISQAVVDLLAKKGVVSYYEEEIYRNPYADAGSGHGGRVTLSPQQQLAYENLYRLYQENQFRVSLLFGVTGSGKTSVFLRLIDEVLSDGKGIIVMVPEIALTSQTLGRFHERYGSKVAVFHSGLSLAQRMDEWKRVRNGEAQIALGTRSAVFAPFRKLGLVIIDEEQEYTYKSENSPRFHARDAARFRCGYHKALLVLASATPSIETYYNATEGGRYGYQVLTHRYGSAILPDVEKIDISQMDVKEGIISPRLYQALRDNLESGRQSILLNNRRGFNTFVSCRACGDVITCPHCSVSMTYHSDNRRLMCHYCGFSMPVPHVCPSCGEPYLRFAGHGTQKAEEELAKLFPEARILRMDADSMTRRSSYDKNLGDFAAGNYDIMIGTQMVAKGLDFPRVTLVGVLMADQALYSDDFRSYERAFSLLTQVVGRSGRGESRGRAIIQTLNPENPVIDMAASQDYRKFYENEIILRKAMLYPPFADLCMVGFVGTVEEEVCRAAEAFMRSLQYHIRREYAGIPIRALGPSPASVKKVSGRYRYKILLKCRNNARFREMMHLLLCESGSDPANKEVTTYADLNPENVL